jgi:hypothetical protein
MYVCAVKRYSTAELKAEYVHWSRRAGVGQSGGWEITIGGGVSPREDAWNRVRLVERELLRRFAKGDTNATIPTLTP